MSEYIERDKLLEHIKDVPTWWADGGGVYPGSMKYPEGMFDPEDVVNSIVNVPAADVAPVVPGKWIDPYDGDAFKCNICGAWYLTRHNYFPNCGVKMDLE